MKKIVIFYGSTTGRTEGVAEKIAEKLGVPSSNVYSASDIKKVDIASYDVFILGSSTWGDGELQDDWYDAIEILKNENLKDKIVALFGCGDSYSYEDTFCDAMGILYKSVLWCCKYRRIWFFIFIFSSRWKICRSCLR